MEILKTSEYNKKQKIKYNELCEAWKPEHGGFPQIAFMFFYDNEGNTRENGFVAINKNHEVWARTKKEAIKKLNNGY